MPLGAPQKPAEAGPALAAYGDAPQGSTRPAVALSDLTHDRWTVVARRVRVTAQRDGWEWLLSPREVSVLQIGVTHGSVTLAQQRDVTGQMVQVAKRARGQRREGEAFAVQGMGMFEQ